jgi:hypothetical protein
MLHTRTALTLIEIRIAKYGECTFRGLAYAYYAVFGAPCPVSLDSVLGSLEEMGIIETDMSWFDGVPVERITLPANDHTRAA